MSEPPMPESPKPNEPPQPRTASLDDALALRRYILDAITYEVDRLTDKQRDPGWTRWAIGATAALVVWSLIGQSSGPLVSRASVGLLYLAALLGISLALVGVIWLHVDRYFLRVNPRYARTDAFLHGSRLLLLLDLVRFAGQGILFIWLFARIGWVGVIAGSVHAAVGAVYTGVILARSYKHVVMPLGLHLSLLRRRRVQWAMFGLIGCLVIASAAVGVAIAEMWEAISPDALKIASQIAALTVLAMLFAWTLSSTPGLDALHEVRRDLAFDRITPEAALARVDTILLGQGIGDVAAEEAIELVCTIGSMEAVTRRLARRVEVIRPVIRDEVALGDVARRQTIRQLLEDAIADLKIYLELSQLATRQQGTFHARVTKLYKLSGEAAPLTEAVERVVCALQANDLEHRRIVQDIRDFLAVVDEADKRADGNVQSDT